MELISEIWNLVLKKLYLFDLVIFSLVNRYYQIQLKPKINAKSRTIPRCYSLISIASAYQYHDLLKWFKNHHYRWDRLTVLYAVRLGNLEILKWIENNGRNIRSYECRYQNFCRIATQHGHLEILKWLINSDNIREYNEICKTAAQYGRLEILNWFVQAGGKIPKSIDFSIIKSRDFKIIKWGEENGVKWHRSYMVDIISSEDPQIISYFQKIGYFDQNIWGITNNKKLLNYKLQNQYHLDKHELCYHAIIHGNISQIKQMDLSVRHIGLLICAARYRQYEMLKWLISQGCVLNSAVSSHISYHGDLEILDWVYQNGCEISQLAYYNAIIRGHLDILKWMKEKDSGWNKSCEIICHVAASCNKLSILKWARENECPWDTRTPEKAIQNNNINILKWVLKNGCPYNSDVGVISARKNFLKLLKWMRMSGYQIKYQKVRDVAIYLENWAIMHWIDGLRYY